MKKVGLTDLKNGLSGYIAQVREGYQFLITEHDKPVAKLVPLADGAVLSIEELIAALIKSGKVQCEKPMSKFESPFTVTLDGVSAADTLIGMRD